MIKGREMIAPRLVLSDVGALARSLLGFLVVTAVALYWASPSVAMFAAGAAAIAGAAANQDTPRWRVPMVTAVSLEMGAAVFLGTLTSAYSALFVGVVAVWCFAVGMQWTVSGNTGLIAAASSALLVVAPPTPPTLSSVAASTALVVAGGLVQAVLIVIWPHGRWRAQRAAVSRAYRSLGADATRLAADPDAHIDPDALVWLRDAFAPADTEGGRRALVHRGWYGPPERIAETLTALAQQGPRDDISAVLTTASAVLDALGRKVRSARPDADEALGQVDAAVAALVGPEAIVAQRLSGQLHEAVKISFGDLSPPMEPVARPHGHGVAGSLAAIGDVVGGELAWTSPIFRHTLRLAGAAPVGVAVARFAGVEHGYWIPLTVLLVLRPETAHTYTRCGGRTFGSALGIAVASAATLMWHPTGLVAGAFAAAALAVCYAVAGIGYVALSAAVAATMVFVIDVNGVADAATIGERLFAVLIGGGLAVVAHAALPDHALVRLRQRAGELLKTEIGYAATVIEAYVGELDHPADALTAAWQRAYRARAAFEAASGATRVESRELRRWLRSYRAALNVVTAACTSLESSAPAQPPGGFSREFIDAVDELVAVLRGAPPSPATPWSIDAAELTIAVQRMRDAAALPDDRDDDAAVRVLTVEVDSITRHLLRIADQPQTPVTE